jgi:hypothetical protein
MMKCFVAVEKRRENKDEREHRDEREMGRGESDCVNL